MPASVTQPFGAVQEPVDVVPADAGKRLAQFIELPYRLYARAEHWVPPLRRDERRRLSRAHNPFFEHARIALFLAVAEDGRVTGRIAAIEDEAFTERHGERIAWFGFFEAEDARAARALLVRVEQWGRDRGSIAVRGPVNPSLNETAGLLVDGFEDDPYVLTPYNPPAYAGFIEGAGYVKVKDLLAWEMELAPPGPERIARLAARVSARSGVRVRPVDMRAFDRDLAIVQAIYRAAWEDNWGFVPPTDAEVRQMAADLKPIVDPELVLFAEMGGRAVACSVAIPDANQVLKRMNGRLLPFGIAHFLRRRRLMTRARLLLLGVLPEVRRIGLYPLLIHESHRRAVARGYTRGEMSWTLEDNDLVNAGIAAVGARRSKTYRLYEKPLG